MNLLKFTEVVGVLCTGLLAGVFFAFETAINPALHRLSDTGYLAAMQHINRLIQNPAFLSVFALPVLLLPLTAWHTGSKITGVSALVYIVVVFGLTLFCNVPLNELLDKFDLNNAAPTELQAMRSLYEMPWNHWHTIRTWAAVGAFFLALYPRIFNLSNLLQSG